MSQPPPPPPHGEVPRSSGLPPGKYDIFVIPQHSSGSGFLYLPSLQPNVNSFAAGFACGLIVVVMFQNMAPAFQTWWSNYQGMGSAAMSMLMVGVSIGAWVLEKPKPTWQRYQQPGAAKTETPKGSWEKAREETRRREEERKAKEEERRAKEEEQKRKDEMARKLKEQREKEAREREQREREARDRREKLEAERRVRMEAERRERELRETLEQERLQRERLQRDKDERDRADRIEREKFEKLERERIERLEREKFLKEAREREAREASQKASTYAYSSMGEKINPWPNGKPKPPAPAPSSASTPPRPPPSTTFTNPNDDQRPPAPSVKTFTGTDDDTYSYRPYDKPKQARGRKNSLSEFSETSWAPSQTTARTSPPPSMRAPYATKDPDKIVIRAVYCFLNQFSKTPVSQLISGAGSVTDGLILRVTTEGLFIDDDVRGVPQREWDVKAWTLKQVEVWCPPHCLTPSPNTPGQGSSAASAASSLKSGAKLRDRGGPKLFNGDDADVYLTEMLEACKRCCRLGLCEATFRNTNISSSSGQTGEWKDKGLHILRATIRDQEGKRYLFVLGEEESWKVAVGLQRLRRGTQARALGVGAMTSADARGCLEMLGWA
ncbi:uncharacterized protein DNG_03344 [Cephalotrichum gorgonifer]|uniref:Trans-sialidase-like protein n=1 Tax=Cephalotrichum gorgonifer TaxID=2041049 RepID=A0AAE8STH1_9PEZI|nr:uncharacterized protein DNG_03344 [Cephalotrichum gorgonifer]